MRAIAVINQKGGVGKTTSVVNIAAALAAKGSRVVVLDFDPQAHLTIHLGLEPQTVDRGSYKVLTEGAEFEEQIMLMRPNLWLLPANIDLVGAESELVSVVGRETILREAMESSRDKFDYCLIDCGPSLGLLTLNALAATEDVLIPLQPHFLALRGLGKLLQTVELVNKRINPNLKVKWVLLCMFDGRASLPNEVKEDIEQFLEHAQGTDRPWSEAKILPVHIRRNIKLAEAPSYGKTIFEYEQHCNGAEDYRKAAECIHTEYHPLERAGASPPVVADEMQEEQAAACGSSLQPEAESGQADTQPAEGQAEVTDERREQPEQRTKVSAEPASEEEQQPEIQPVESQSGSIDETQEQQVSEQAEGLRPGSVDEVVEEAPAGSEATEESESQAEPQAREQPVEIDEIQSQPPIEIKSIAANNKQQEQGDSEEQGPELTESRPEQSDG
jgi:chromosome partitioning protein